VADGESGRLTPEGRVAPFRRAIAGLLARPDLRRKMSQGAIAGSSMFHDIDLAASHLDQVLRRAVERARKRRRP
jgi:hypothetical protein